MKYTDKVMIPKEDHPDGHFFGLIIGRGGKTFKMLEKEKLNLINEAEKIVTNTIIFTIFSGPDHLTIDCKFRKKRNNAHIELNPDGSLTINGNRQKQQKLYCQYQSLINELMDDQRNLMTEYKTTGPTLAITDETSSSITDSVNKRLNKIVHDSIFTNDFSLFMSTSDGLVYSLSYLILYRFYSHILPSIDRKIQWVHLESKKLPSFKSFWLHCETITFVYDELVLPLLYRINFNDKQIIYWTDYFPKVKKGYCQIYSYPYQLKYYNNINNFQGGIFKYVRQVELYDQRPFQHEFFFRIAKLFPLMEELIMHNEQRQINKQFRKSRLTNH
ncbi:unnamed protein product [Rotaria sordida]|uniref:K Homology domain-containing protein n=1 Tax=Rotaria sordida TaxID=392033 RepID=A0A818U1D8_9BILA|nr:unnamed protein product [Rotaria sordida]